MKAREGVTGVYLSGSLRLWAYPQGCILRQEGSLLTEGHSLGERRCQLGGKGVLPAAGVRCHATYCRKVQPVVYALRHLGKFLLPFGLQSTQTKKLYARHPS